MKYLNTKLYIWLLIIISITLYSIYFSLSFYFIDSQTAFDYLKPIPTVVSLDLAIIFIFVKWLWKWNKLYPWFVPFPNLNGTWKGQLQSNWICPNTKEKIKSIPIILTINQSFTNTSCIMRTEEMCSESFSGEIIRNIESEKSKIIYSYKSDPRADIRHRSPSHFGTVVLDIVNNNLKLDGEYWTSRETTGIIKLEFWKKEKLDSYPEEIGEHPMSNTRTLDYL